MITPITSATELSEISGGRRRFSFIRDFSRTGNNIAESVASASGDEVETSVTATTSENGVSGSSSSSSSSSFSSSR